MDLGSYSDSESRELGDSAWCECGRPKERKLECCQRCRYLDFGSPTPSGFGNSVGAGRQWQVIAALRNVRAMTVLELCRALGANTDPNNGRTAMLRTLQRMMRQRRVRRVWSESDSVEIDTRGMTGPIARFKRKAVPGQWLYMLDGLSEREWGNV